MKSYSTIQSLINNNADFAFAASEIHNFLWEFNDKVKTAIGINHNQNSLRKQRKDIPLQYLEIGSGHVMKTEGFIKNKKRNFVKIPFYSVPNERVCVIDNHNDLSDSRALSSILDK